jgi:hypothetical protein
VLNGGIDEYARFVVWPKSFPQVPVTSLRLAAVALATTRPSIPIKLTS